MYKFPMPQKQEATRWHDIVIKHLNSKCRSKRTCTQDCEEVQDKCIAKFNVCVHSVVHTSIFLIYKSGFHTGF